MERGFLSQKRSRVGRGVKEKQVLTGVKLVDRTMSNTDADTGLFTKSDGTLNDANPLKEVVSPSVIDEHGAMEVQSPLVAQTYSVQNPVVEETVAMEYPVVNTPNVGPNPPLPTQEANSVGNASDKPSYATVKPNGKKVNVRTLFTPGGNVIDVVVPVDSIRAIRARFANTAYCFFLGKKVAYPVVANYVRNTWGKYRLVRSMFNSSTKLFSFQFSSMDGLDAMLENGPWFIRNNPLILKKWHPDENLLKEDVSTVSVWVKLHGVPVTAFSEDGLSGRSSYARVMIELRADVELKDNIVVAMPKITMEGHYTCAGEKKTVKKPSQTSRGVLVGLKMGFKLQKEYRPVPKKPNDSSSGNKKKSVEPEVSNLNPFDILNSVDNDVEFCTNGGTANLVNNEATSSGSSFMNIDNDEQFASNTPIGKKIDKIERQIYEGKLRLLDNDGNPLVPTGIVKSDSEVEVRDSYPDNDDYDPYDADMYENHDLSEHLQSICDDLDITVLGRKKK
ncbi:nucleotide-diphospho-sugar transferase [Tanacetum coccineum]